MRIQEWDGRRSSLIYCKFWKAVVGIDVAL